MTIANWSTTPGNNNDPSPDGIAGSRAISTIVPVVQQIMADTRSWYNDAQWTDLGDTPTYVSTTSFTIGSDVTTTYTMGRKVKLYGSVLGTHTGVILSSTFSSPNTTIVVKMDAGTALTSNISQVFLAVPSSKFNALSTWASSPKNLIIGGDFSVNPWQRGTSFTGAATGAYTADRWQWLQSSDMVVSIQKHTAAPTIAQCGVYTAEALEAYATTESSGSTATRFAGLSYKIEGYDAAQINHQLYTIGFWVRATKIGTYCVALRNSGRDRSYIFEYTVNTTLTWEYKILQLSAASSSAAGTWDYTNGIGLELFFTVQAGSNYQTTASAWQSGNYLATSSQVNSFDTINNLFEINLVSVIKGLGVYDWADDLFSDTLRKCQRYYWKSYSQGTVPGAASATGAFYIVSTGISSSIIDFVAPTEFRISSPSSTIYAPLTGSSGSFTETAGGTNVAATVLNTGGRSISYATTSTPSQGTRLLAHIAVSAEL